MSKSAGLLLLLTLALSPGCAPMRYSQYTGPEMWSGSPGSGTMADEGYAIPVYRGWPERPYRVVGSIQFSNPNDHWDDGDTARAARLAKSKKGDAIVMRSGAEFGVGKIAGAAADSRVQYVPHQVSVLVVQWKAEEELNRERAALETFEATFRGKYPDLNLRRDLIETGVAFVGWQGLRLEGPDDRGRARLEAVLVEVLQASKDVDSSKWLFKGTLQSSGLASSYTQPVYGVATLTQTADSVTLASAPGSTADISFSGSAKGGHLSGQLGVTAGTTILAARAEGVLVPDRITLSGQAQTADGLAQTSLIFTR